MKSSFFSHAFVASCVLNIVMGCLLHQMYSGKLAVQIASSGWPF